MIEIYISKRFRQYIFHPGKLFFTIYALSAPKGMTKMEIIDAYNDVCKEIFSYAMNIPSPSMIYDFDQLKGSD